MGILRRNTKPVNDFIVQMGRSSKEYKDILPKINESLSAMDFGNKTINFFGIGGSSANASVPASVVSTLSATAFVDFDKTAKAVTRTPPKLTEIFKPGALRRYAKGTKAFSRPDYFGDALGLSGKVTPSIASAVQRQGISLRKIIGIEGKQNLKSRINYVDPKRFIENGEELGVNLSENSFLNRILKTTVHEFGHSASALSSADEKLYHAYDFSKTLGFLDRVRGIEDSLQVFPSSLTPAQRSGIRIDAFKQMMGDYFNIMKEHGLEEGRAENTALEFMKLRNLNTPEEQLASELLDSARSGYYDAAGGMAYSSPQHPRFLEAMGLNEDLSEKPNPFKKDQHGLLSMDSDSIKARVGRIDPDELAQIPGPLSGKTGLTPSQFFVEMRGRGSLLVATNFTASIENNYTDMNHPFDREMQNMILDEKSGAFHTVKRSLEEGRLAGIYTEEEQATFLQNVRNMQDEALAEAQSANRTTRILDIGSPAAQAGIGGSPISTTAQPFSSSQVVKSMEKAETEMSARVAAKSIPKTIEEGVEVAVRRSRSTGRLLGAATEASAAVVGGAGNSGALRAAGAVINLLT